MFRLLLRSASLGGGWVVGNQLLHRVRVGILRDSKEKRYATSKLPLSTLIGSSPTPSSSDEAVEISKWNSFCEAEGEGGDTPHRRDGSHIAMPSQQTPTEGDALKEDILSRPMAPSLLHLPLREWGLELPLEGFRVLELEHKSDGNGLRLLAIHPHKKFVVSVVMEAATEADEDLKQNFRKKTMAEDSNIEELSEEGEEFLRASATSNADGALRYHHWVIRKDVGTEIQLVKSTRVAEGSLAKEFFVNMDFFTDFIDKTRVVRPREPDSSEFAHAGNKCLKAREVREAIQYFGKALKSRKPLARKLERTLTNNLAVAYALAGHDTKSLEILKEALAKDPDYHNYYYNIACVYAERGDGKQAVQWLEKAFLVYEATRKALEGTDEDGELADFPNPLYDASFDKIKESSEFKAAVVQFQMRENAVAM